MAAEVVAKERRRLIHVHDEDVDVAIVVEIAKGHAAAGVDFGNAGAGLFEQFFEFAAAQIPEHHVGRLVGGIGEFLFHLGIDHAGGAEKVRQTIVVEVHDAGAPGYETGFHSQTGAQRHIDVYKRQGQWQRDVRNRRPAAQHGFCRDPALSDLCLLYTSRCV